VRAGAPAWPGLRARWSLALGHSGLRSATPRCASADDVGLLA